MSVKSNGSKVFCDRNKPKQTFQNPSQEEQGYPEISLRVLQRYPEMAFHSGLQKQVGSMPGSLSAIGRTQTNHVILFLLKNMALRLKVGWFAPH